MNRFLNSPIGRLRVITFLEGVSLLVLVFIAMPMKYALDMPDMVRYAGMAHGVLFLAFILLAVSSTLEYKWPMFSTSWKFLLASFIPFGTFYLDKKVLSPVHEEVR